MSDNQRNAYKVFYQSFRINTVIKNESYKYRLWNESKTKRRGIGKFR